MRMMHANGFARTLPVFALVVALVWALGFAPGSLNAQRAALSPEEGSAKARALLQKTIQALGGDAFLNVKDIECSGRFAQFGPTSGELMGYAAFLDYRKLPDKRRTEYFKQRNIITVNNGDRVWELDRGGVQEGSVAAGKAFLEGAQTSIDAILRFRLSEEGIILRYAGDDVEDLKEVTWVEIQDKDRRVVRVAIERSTGRPLHSVFISRDPETRERFEQVTIFALYHDVQGTQTPFNVSRERNGRKVSQVFYDECKYNTGLQDSFFTKEALEQRFAELNKGKKKK